MKPFVFGLFFLIFTQPALWSQPMDFDVLFRSDTTKGGTCYRIPAIITAADGTLIAAADQRISSCGDLRWNNDINIVIRRSLDGGKSWLPMTAVVDYPTGKSASDPSMILDATTETIFLFFNFMDHEAAKDIYHQRYMSSHDHGASWSNPIDITGQISLPEWSRDFKFISSGQGIQTSDGTLLHTLVNLEHGLHLFGSQDHGQSWQLLTGALFPGDESKVAELTNGNWTVNSRVNGLGHRYIHRSTDKGATWVSQPDNRLPDPGCNAGLIVYTLQNGQEVLLFSNVADTSERRHLTLSISFDAGQHWTSRHSIWEGAAAYSDIILLPDGNLGVLFEKDDYGEIVFVKIGNEIILQHPVK